MGNRLESSRTAYQPVSTENDVSKIKSMMEMRESILVGDEGRGLDERAESAVVARGGGRWRDSGVWLETPASPCHSSASSSTTATSASSSTSAVPSSSRNWRGECTGSLDPSWSDKLHTEDRLSSESWSRGNRAAGVNQTQKVGHSMESQLAGTDGDDGKGEFSAFVSAARYGCNDLITLMIKLGIPAECAVDHNGCTALHAACENGHVDSVKLLLEHYVDIEARDNSKRTPLHVACQNGDLQIVRMLLDHQADFSSMDDNGDTCMSSAAAYGNTKICSYLLKRGCPINEKNFQGASPLHRACENDQHTTAEMLMDNGADLNSVQKNGCSCLLAAAHYGCIEVTKLLISRHVDLDYTNAQVLQLTALHVASTGDQVEIVHLLLEAGASVDKCATNGDTPLLMAIINSNSEVVRALLKSGASVDRINKKAGYAPLHLAVSVCSSLSDECLNIVQQLLYGGADASMALYGNSAVHVACRAGNLEALDVLLKLDSERNRGCRHALPKVVELKDNGGCTALHHACRLDHPDIVQLLLDYGADVDSLSEEHVTPLCVASYHAHYEICVRLIRAGATPTLQDRFGRSPITMARSANDTRLVELFGETMHTGQFI